MPRHARPSSAQEGRASASPTAGANLWVDTNGGSCSRSAKGGNYTDPQACGSFQAAYGAARCGDVVGVRPGSYSSQTISSRKSCSPTTLVTFTSVPGCALQRQQRLSACRRSRSVPPT